MTFDIIPAIDLLDGQVVRLKQGDYTQVTNYNHLSPGEWAKAMEDNGVKRLHVVDLNGAKTGELVNLNAIRDIRKATKAKIDLGGGIRTQKTAESLFNEGIDYLVIGSILAKNFEASKVLIQSFPHKLIAGLDAKNMNLAVEGWIEDSGISIPEILKKLNPLPLHSIIYTDISKDGMLSGPNIDALCEVAALSQHSVIASGGIGTLAHIQEVRNLAQNGISGCIVGKAILSGNIPIAAALA